MVTVAVMTPPKPSPLPVRVVPAAEDAVVDVLDAEPPQAARLSARLPARIRDTAHFITSFLLAIIR